MTKLLTSASLALLLLSAMAHAGPSFGGHCPPWACGTSSNGPALSTAATTSPASTITLASGEELVLK